MATTQQSQAIDFNVLYLVQAVPTKDGAGASFVDPPQFAVSDPTVLALSPGDTPTSCKVRGIKIGSATLTCIADGVEDDVLVTVNPPFDKISLSFSPL